MRGSARNDLLADLGIQHTRCFANLDAALSVDAGPRLGGTPAPFSSLLPVWNKAEVLGPLLRILRFIHFIGERA